MRRFRIQLLLEDNTWSTQYNIAKILKIVIILQIGH